MIFKTIEDLKAAGFEGFVSVADLRNGGDVKIPESPGVYMVVRVSDEEPEFVEIGSGGHFKKRNPNVPIADLNANWVDGTCVVYIGKAGGSNSSATLQSRIGQYLQFGLGKAVGHWGGRYVWQLKDASKLLFCWKEFAVDKEPKEVETELIREFRGQYGDRRPFANLKD